MVYLQLHASGIFLIGGVTLALRLASASVCGVYTNLVVLPSLKVEELVLALGTNILYLVLP